MMAKRSSGSVALNVAYCEGFRMPIVHGGAANSNGQRPQASKGGNRDDERNCQTYIPRFAQKIPCSSKYFLS